MMCKNYKLTVRIEGKFESILPRLIAYEQCKTKSELIRKYLNISEQNMLKNK